MWESFSKRIRLMLSMQAVGPPTNQDDHAKQTESAKDPPQPYQPPQGQA